MRACGLSGRTVPYIERLVHAFEARIDDAEGFARANRVLLLRTRAGVHLDIALAGLPFEETAIERSSLFRFPPDVLAPFVELKEASEILARLEQRRIDLDP